MSAPCTRDARIFLVAEASKRWADANTIGCRVRSLSMKAPSPALPDHLLTLQSHDGARIAVSLFGGQLSSWQTSDGRERLFISRNAHWDGLHPIRGGVPIIFPQFGAAGPGPRHGIARTLMWTLANRSNDKDQPAQMQLQLISSIASKKMSDGAVVMQTFTLQLTINFSGNALHITLDIGNTSASTLTFCAALHTYLKCNVEKSCIYGLQHNTYRDAVDNDLLKNDAEKMLQIEREVDRLYLNTSSDIELRDDTGIMTLSQTGFPDTVVWNPWVDKTRSLTDCTPHDYLNFVCIESALAAVAQQLPPQQRWRGTQSLRVSDL